MTGTLNDQIASLGTALAKRTDRLARITADTIIGEVEVYRSGAIPIDEVLRSCRANLQFVLSGLDMIQNFDTAPAASAGKARAAAGVPLAQVMEAFRIGFQVLAAAVQEESRTNPALSSEALLISTERMWLAHDLFVRAMSDAYRQQQLFQIRTEQSERAALIEALFEGRAGTHPSIWDIAEQLRFPVEGPYIVIVAALPGPSRSTLPEIESKLDSRDIPSVWRLRPDLQIGLARTTGEASLGAVTSLLNRIASTRVGISPPFSSLLDIRDGLYYARAALNADSDRQNLVTVFEDSLLARVAASAPTASISLARRVLADLGDLRSEETRTLIHTFRQWLSAGGSINFAATELCCHPNTVRFRLRRIEERTGRSLAKPKDVAELCFVLEVEKWIPPG